MKQINDETIMQMRLRAGTFLSYLMRSLGIAKAYSALWLLAAVMCVAAAPILYFIPSKKSYKTFGG